MDPQDAAPREQKKAAAAKLKEGRSFKTNYLILYNVVSAALWSLLLIRILNFIRIVGTDWMYPGNGEYAKWTQTLAMLEIVHAATGIVRSPVSTTALQVASRTLLVWGIVNNFPWIARSPAYTSMLIAWSVTEIIRYSYFVLNLSGRNSRVITWLRYNTFFVLYPIGISSEWWLVYLAVKPATEERAELKWVLYAILGIYVPGSYILFTHMMKQRKKVLQGNRVKKTQ